MRYAGMLGLLCAAAVAGCNTKANQSATLIDSAGGDVPLDTAIEGVVFHGVKQPLTSDNFRKFTVAQQALDTINLRGDIPRVSLANPTDEEIERTVTFLEQEPPARRAIEDAGLSVKDFVLTSLALGQALSFPDPARVVLPRDNVVFIEQNRGDVERVREPRRIRLFVDDDVRRLRDDEDDDDDDRGVERRGRDDERRLRRDDGDDHRGRGRGRGRGGDDRGRHGGGRGRG